jgi:periplasmic divalent cation tolerance protein
VSVLLALCTTPNEETAARLARSLVEEHLAACVNRIASVRSTYLWGGDIHDDAEVLLLIKTTRERFEALKSRLPGLHPYGTPELIAFEATDGLAAYLGWVAAQTAAQ